MTFKDFDAGGPTEDSSKQRGVVDVGVASERGVEGQEPLHLREKRLKWVLKTGPACFLPSLRTCRGPEHSGQRRSNAASR